MTAAKYDAILIVSFGGPEGRVEVLPFLEKVLHGRNVPRKRLLAVAKHYDHLGGISPINAQNRALVAAIEAELERHGPKLPVYFGNRNWNPLLTDTLRQMRDDGVQHAMTFFTSSFSSYSGCRQYRENIAAAQAEVGLGAPQVDKLRAHFNHPGFIESMIERTAAALDQIPADRRAAARLAFTAHSIPSAMAAHCAYEAQLHDACQLVAAGVGHSQWQLVYQSRSGSPSQPWLEPDIGDHLRMLAAVGVREVVVVPIGFVSDHMEVLYDLDYEAKQLAGELGIHLFRAGTVGTHPRFVAMIRELIVERMTGAGDRPALGTLGPSHDVCPADCCLNGQQT
ncbi:MAG: ferrochelatase [Pirellulales bacterium]|nr:ferrochelatase [Pirellulales bacterium]